MDDKDAVASLDAQIWKAQIRLRATEKMSAAAGVSTTDSPATINSLQQAVMREKLKLQQEHLLLKRMTLGKAACDAEWRHPSLSSNNNNNDDDDNNISNNEDDDDNDNNNDSNDEDYATLLRREAARARNKQVTLGLQRQRELAALVSENRDLEVDCHRQRLENRTIFRQLLQQKKQKQSGDLAAAADSSEDDDNHTATATDGAPVPDGSKQQKVLIAKENTILKCLLKDLVAGSGLDWYSDARLRRILLNTPEDD